jgi:Mor family transcriptional regulator
MMNSARENYPEILQDLFDKVADLVRDQRVGAAAADEAAFRLTEHLRAHWSGCNLYVLMRDLQGKPEGEGGLFGVPAAERPAEAKPHAISLERLRQLGDVLFRDLVGLGVEPALSGRCADALVDFLRRDWLGGCDGNRRLYIPKGRSYELNLRDYTIWRELRSPADLPRLMAQHGLTLQRIYQINKMMQARHRKREQPPLPGMDIAGNQ